MRVEEPDDLILVRRVLRGESDAFRLLVRRYGGRLRGFCQARLGDSDEADDAVQDVFLRAYRSLAGFRIGASFPSWLFAIAANHVRTRRSRAALRGALAVKAADDARAAAVADPADQAMASLAREEVRRAVARLSGPQRVVVELYYFAGLTVEETGAALGLGAEAVKSRLLRARRELGRALSASAQPELRRDGIRQ